MLQQNYNLQILKKILINLNLQKLGEIENLPGQAMFLSVFELISK